jgi:hypothetical protein
MISDHTPRGRAQAATTRAIEDLGINSYLARDVARKLVNIALDAYEDQLANDLAVHGWTKGYAVLIPAGEARVFPTRRAARHYRRVFLRATGYDRLDVPMISAQTLALV